MRDSDRRKLRIQHFGSWLKATREAAGLTQKDIANAFDWGSAQFVSNWERGCSLPPPDRIADLARLLQVKPHHLLEMVYFAKHAELAAEEQEALRSIKSHLRRAG